MRALSLLALAMLLAGCVSVPRRETPALDPIALHRELQQLQQYSFEGRLAVAAGSEGFNADLSWKQQGTRSTVDLRAPLGFGSARIVHDDEVMEFTSSRGERLSGTDAIAALEQRLGFAAPLGALRYWILGVADPAMTAIQMLDATGRLASLEQNGWNVEYAEYRNVDNSATAVALPRRMTLRRDAIRLRLVVNRWQLNLQ